MKIINPPSVFEDGPVEVIENNPPAPASASPLSQETERLWSYDDYQKVLTGRGTVCIPMASTASEGLPMAAGGEVPSPADYILPIDETRRVWDEVVKDSNQRAIRQVGKEAVRCLKDRRKDIADLLDAALQAGNIDLAMLLVSGLETREANEIAGGLLRKIGDLQDQRKAAANQISQLGKTDEDTKKLQQLNIDVGNMGTEIQMLQTFLQDVMSQKSEAQQMASNFLKSRHETAMGIIRNSG